MVGPDGLIRVDCEFCSHSFPIALARFPDCYSKA
jgi:redox-regulated HSP33 family molecular chaperone